MLVVPQVSVDVDAVKWALCHERQPFFASALSGLKLALTRNEDNSGAISGLLSVRWALARTARLQFLNWPFDAMRLPPARTCRHRPQSYGHRRPMHTAFLSKI